MPYTLSMTALWLALAGLLGGIIGWLLRNAMCGKHTASLKATPPNTSEVDKLRHRVANLEPAVAERDKLKVQLGKLEADLKAAKIAAPAVAVGGAGIATLASGIGQKDYDVAIGERDGLKAQLAKLEGDLQLANARPAGIPQADLDAAVAAGNMHSARIGELEAALAVANAKPAGVAQADYDAALAARDANASRAADLEASLADCQAKAGDHEFKIQGLMSQIAATPVVPDNLQLVVGIGPVNEKLLNGGGIFTFEQMISAGIGGMQDIMPDLQDARIEKEDWVGQATKFVAAKRDGIDPASVARDGQVK